MVKTGEAYIGSRTQRAFDVIASTSLGIGTLPLMGATAIALGVEQRSARTLFRQRRIGKKGEQFDIFKIRTIPGQDQSGNFELGGSEHPDASKVAKIVRKLGIDELPQCINVLAGDLHMVGVRTQIPITREQRRQADPALYDEWAAWADLNPGLIGLGQKLAHLHPGAYAENSALIRDVMRLDIFGCEHASLRNDVDCLIGTPLSTICSAVDLLRNKSV